MNEILSTFRLMPENKEEIWRFSKGLIQSIYSGNIGQNEMNERLNSLEEIIFVVRNINEIIPVFSENKRREAIQSNVIEQPDLVLQASNSQKSEKPFPI
jgi:DNA gyrase/topoisomerase IV subunit A